MALPRWRLGAAAAGAVSLLFATSLVVVPAFGLLIAPLGLIPVVQLGAAGGRSSAAWGWVVALLCLTAAVGGGSAALRILAAYVLVVVVPSLSVEAWRATGASEGRWLGVTTAAVAVGTLAAIAVASAPDDPITGIGGMFRNAAGQTEAFYRELGVPQGQIDRTLDLVERLAAWVLPSLVVGYSVAVLFWLRSRLPALGFPIQVEPFERWRNDEWLALAFVAAGVGTLLLDGTGRWVAVNLLGAVIILYFAQGLAMIRAHLARLVGRGWLVRWALALLCLQVPLLFLVAAIGVADSFADLRPRAEPDGRIE